MKYTWLFLLFLANIYYTNGQRISNIDMDSISLSIKDASSVHYYPVILETFLKNQDTIDIIFDSLSAEGYTHLYYGWFFQEGYKADATETENESVFLDLYHKNQYAEAIPFGELAVKESPVNIVLLHKLALAGNYTGNSTVFWNYFRKYTRLLNAIKSSGDGKTATTAFVVINVYDEYEVLSDLELKKDKQSEENGCDKFNIRQPNELNTSVLYFNKSLTLQEK